MERGSESGEHLLYQLFTADVVHRRATGFLPFPLRQLQIPHSLRSFVMTTRFV